MFELPVLTFKLLIVSYITSKRQLIHDRTASRNGWNQSYDFIIVGAGGSACIMANRLSEDPNFNVLLLEVGQPLNTIYNDIPPMASYVNRDRPDLNWHYYYEPEDNLGLSYPAHRLRTSTGRLIGGSSSRDGFVFHRGNRRDYDNWAQTYGAEDWSYREVLPFFIRYENNTNLQMVINNPGYHGTDGPIQLTTPQNIPPILREIQKVFNEFGFYSQDLNADNQTGTMISLTNIDQRGLRSAAAVAYIDPNPHPNNLHIVTGALVIKILFNGLTAIGVEFDRNDTSYRVYARKEVILSAGVFQTPQLLMLSGIGPRNQLQSLGIPVLIDLPVGQNYQANVVMNIYPNINSSLQFFQMLTIDNLIQLYLNGTGPLSEVPAILLKFSTRLNEYKDWPNSFLVARFSQDRFHFQLFITETRSRGRVYLQSTSPYIQPIIDTNFFSDSKDFDNIFDAIQFLLFLIETSNLKQFMTPQTFESVGCHSCEGKYMYECESGIRCWIQRQAFLYDDCCTCRMGAIERKDIVIGPDIRVKHANNLRICDASIYPRLSNSGLDADTFMIGEKCSQIIKDFYNLN